MRAVPSAGWADREKGLPFLPQPTVPSGRESGEDRLPVWSRRCNVPRIRAQRGRRINDGLLGPRTVTRHTVARPLGDGTVPIDDGTGNRGEVQEAAGTVAGRGIDALVISIGIGDVGILLAGQ